MKLTDNKMLFDVTMRLALFLENIKIDQFRLFNQVLSELDLELRKLLSRIDHKTLDGLTKAELNRLLLQLRKSQSRIYSAYTEKLIAQLQEFMQLRLQVGVTAYASLKWNFEDSKQKRKDLDSEDFVTLSEEKAFEYLQAQAEKEKFNSLFGLAVVMPSSKASLWSTVTNAPIPANGLYLLAFIAAFSRSAQASVENIVRKAYSNRLTVEETIAALTGAKAVQGNSTQLAKIKNQAVAVIETAFSHVDQMAAQAVTSAIFEHYKWASIIDNATTEVCLRRDGNVYRYGEGPIPPAHYKCRSVTVPLASLFDDFTLPTLYSWLRNQPRKIQIEFLGSELAERLDNGKLSAKEFSKLQIGKALPLSQFKNKLGLILKP